MTSTRTTEGLVVHVVDDDSAVRSSLVLLLESSRISVRAYSSAAEFLRQIPNVAAGCILTDFRMPDMDGLELQQRLIELDVKLPVIVMTGHADVPLAIRALRAGAAGFIEKPFEYDVLIGAVRTALEAGESRRHAETTAAEIETRLNSLTPREREVLDALMTGASHQGIARALGISPHTVEVHRACIIRKMRTRTLSELIRLVIAGSR